MALLSSAHAGMEALPGHAKRRVGASWSVRFQTRDEKNELDSDIHRWVVRSDRPATLIGGKLT